LTTYKSLQQRVIEVKPHNFDGLAIDIFRYQSSQNSIYKSYIRHLGINPDNVKRIQDIPFLPISFFKHHKIQTEEWQETMVFESSGTTGMLTSKHYARHPGFYLKVARQIFENFYGSHQNYYFLFLLPSYLEREGSSLVYMADDFIKASNSDHSGFYMSDYNKLVEVIKMLQKINDRKIVLWGVTFALLELSESFDLNLSDCLIMETGGMKGRRKELTRKELHETLIHRFHTKNIHSEYGMTELFSQCYSQSEGYFSSPDSMKIILRDPNDPFDIGGRIKTGGINVIDLANVHSCAFIETQDLGRIERDQGFQILGRFDNSDIRGCNLLL